MSFRIPKRVQVTVACLAVISSLYCATAVRAQCCGDSSSSQSTSSAPARGHSSSNHRSSDDDLGLNSRTLQPQYGGQVTATKWHFFEVVYTPQETRIYAYSPSRTPLYSKGIRGEVVMQVEGNPQPFRYPVKEAADAQGRIYGSVVVDVTQVRDGDMEVAFDLERLPFKQEERARFTQTFYMTRPPVPVTVARLTEVDRPLVERQRMCPVADAGLGEHGAPIKLMVGNEPLFVCCDGCVDQVKKDPQHYMRKAAAAPPATRQPPRPQVAVYWATQDDDAAIRAQHLCPVMDQPLGEHGKPIKVVIDGRPIFVCCEGCIDKVVQNRDSYFRKVVDAGMARRTAPPSERQPPARPHAAVSFATAADRPAVEAQHVCPVMNQPLGAHGTPIKILIDGQPVFVCCKGCVSKVEGAPNLYLSKVIRGQQSDDYSRQDDWFYRKPEPSNTGGSGGSCCGGSNSGGGNSGAICH